MTVKAVGEVSCTGDAAEFSQVADDQLFRGGEVFNLTFFGANT